MTLTVVLSNTKIDIISGDEVGNTLEEVYQAVIAQDPARMNRTGTGPYIYTISPKAGQVYCELVISSGVKITCEQNDTLQWSWGTTSSTYYILDITSNSELVVEEGFTFDFDIAGTHRGYAYFLGKITMIGTVSNYIVLKHMRSVYTYAYQDELFQYVKYQDSTYISGYLFNYSNHSTVSTGRLIVENCIFEDTRGSYNGYIYFAYGVAPFHLVTFKNNIIDHIRYGLMNYVSTAKVEGCTIKNCYEPSSLCYGSGHSIGSSYKPSKMSTEEEITREIFQPYTYFKNCKFIDNDLGVYCSDVYYRSHVLFEDCEWEGISYSNMYALRVYYNSIAFLINPVFTNIRIPPVYPNINSKGAVLYSDWLTVNVKDDVGDPIENAVISIIQSEDKLKLNGLTDSNGALKNVWENNVLLPIKEEISDGVYENWANDIEGRYYEIFISFPNKVEYYEKFTFTGEKTIEAILIDIDAASYYIDQKLEGKISTKNIEGSINLITLKGKLSC